MIIGIDASRANSQKKTGTEWYAFYLIEQFKKIVDPEDQIILYSKEALDGALGKLPANFQSRVLRWPAIFLWTQIRLAWEMLWHRPDVLFVPAHTIPIIHPRHTVTTIHDVGFERFQALYSSKQIGPSNKALRFLLRLLVTIATLGKYSNTELDYHRWSARFAVKHASTIITVSNFSAHDISRFFPTSVHKLHVIYHACSIDYGIRVSDQIRKSILQKYAISNPYFLYIGRLEEKKNTANLITAFQSFKKNQYEKTILVLVGSPGYGYERIRQLIEQENQNPKSIWQLGWINREDQPALMQAAMAFVFPTAYEGFGLPVLEAMTSGTPVITSRGSSTEEVADGAALLVNQNDPKSIADAMRQIVSNQQLRQRLIALGMKRSQQFSWHDTAQKTLALITARKT